MASMVDEDDVIHQEPTMSAEDFSYMLLEKPGAYCFILNPAVTPTRKGRFEASGW